MKKLINKENILVIIVIIGVLIISIVPILLNEVEKDGDIEYHITRIQSLADSMEAGIFPVKVHANMGNAFGYGSGLFYSNLFLYIPAFLILIGVNIILAYRIFLILITIAVFATVYLATKHIVKNKYAALFSATLVISSHYFFMNIIQRAAIGEALAYIFLPLIIVGMYDVFYNNFKKPIYLIVGFVGIIYSHIISIVIALVYCIVFSLIHIKQLLNKEIIIKLLKCILIVFILTCAFALPFFEQYFVQEYNFSKPWANPKDHCVTVENWFSNTTFCLGVPLVCTLIISLILLIIKRKEINKEIKIFAVIAIVLSLLPLWKWFWGVTSDFTNIIQFPWRLFGIATIFISIVASYILLKLKFLKDKRIIVIIGILIFLIQNILNFQFFNFYRAYVGNPPITEVIDFDTSSATWQDCLGFREYLPLDMNSWYLPTQIALLEDEEEIIGNKEALKFVFNVSDINEETYCDIPFIYYKGYNAYITYEDGTIEELDVVRAEGKGKVRVLLPQVEKAEVLVQYEGTVIQKISYVITIVGFVAVIIYFVRKKK